ncbi:MAG: iron ABC transporter permease, partial [Eggerthellaceae bacterium]|nr:iron ABC transporter permease [Eggerthellaceae bacterium]
IVLVALYFVGLIIPKDLLNSALHSGGYSTGYSFAWFVEDLQENVAGIVSVFTGNDAGPAPYSWTMLRYIVVALAGAGLAICVAGYQGGFRNGLVSPATLGVMSGATFGMMIWTIFFLNEDGSNATWVTGLGASSLNQTAVSAGWDDLWSSYGLALCCFGGCIVVVVLVLLTLRVFTRGSSSGIVMIIVGQVVGGVLGAIVNTVRYYYVTVEPDGAKASFMTEMQAASFYRTFTVVDVLAVAIPLALCFFVVLRLRHSVMALTLDEAEAHSLGVDTQRTKIIVVIVCTLLTAIIVSFCGRIGFVGFLVPHLARRMVGPNPTYLLPAAMVLGAVFVLGAFVLLSATLGTDYEAMTGIFVSIGGAVVFLITAIRGRGADRGGFLS